MGSTKEFYTKNWDEFELKELLQYFKLCIIQNMSSDEDLEEEIDSIEAALHKKMSDLDINKKN